MQRWAKALVLALVALVVVGVVVRPRLFGVEQGLPEALPTATTPTDAAAAAPSPSATATGTPTLAPEADRVLALQNRLEADAEDFEAWKEMGQILLEAGEYGPASESFAAALEVRQDDAAVWAGLGDSLLYQGMVRVARAQYRRALEIDPKLTSAQLNLGITLSHALPADIPGAVAAWREVIELEPGSELAAQAQGYLDKYAPAEGTPTPTATPGG